MSPTNDRLLDNQKTTRASFLLALVISLQPGAQSPPT